MSSSRVKPKAVPIKVLKPEETLHQALSRYKGLINMHLKIPEKDDPGTPWLKSVDFTIDFKKAKLKETGMKPSEYNSPQFQKAGITPDTLCYYLALIRNNLVRFDNKDHNSGYLVHHLAYPTELKTEKSTEKVSEGQIKQDMCASMIEYLITYGLEWIEHSVQRQAKNEVAKSNMKVNKSVEELENLANELGK